MSNLDSKEWKTFDDWMKEHKYVVMKGEKGTYVDGKYYFHRDQVTFSKLHPFSRLWRKSCATVSYELQYWDKGWCNPDWDRVEWERFV
tara:strand:+ start:837 stop:1100 length:264 start_codon:yes stop_codon:yes gene_type:complete